MLPIVTYKLGDANYFQGVDWYILMWQRSFKTVVLFEQKGRRLNHNNQEISTVPHSIVLNLATTSSLSKHLIVCLALIQLYTYLSLLWWREFHHVF